MNSRAHSSAFYELGNTGADEKWGERFETSKERGQAVEQRFAAQKKSLD